MIHSYPSPHFWVPDRPGATITSTESRHLVSERGSLMKIRNVHPCGDIVVIIPGNPPRQVEVEAGAEFEVSKEESAVLLSSDDFEAVTASKEK